MNVTQFTTSTSSQSQSQTAEVASISRNPLDSALAVGQGTTSSTADFAQLQAQANTNNLITNQQDLDAIVQDGLTDLTVSSESVQTPPLQSLDHATNKSDNSTITGDKKQDLLTYLLDIAEPKPTATAVVPATTSSTVPLPTPVTTSVTTSVPTATVETPTTIGSTPVTTTQAVSAALQQVQAQAITAELNDRVNDSKIPVLPMQFGQSLTSTKKENNAENLLASLPKNTSITARPLIESLDSIKPVIAATTDNQVQQQGSETVARMQWAPTKLQGERSEMAQQLHSVLRERLQVQADSKVQQATIRLDPPTLGKIDISLHIDAGRLNVQINATQTDVYRALQQVSNDLRQNLVEQNFLQVNVQVSSQHSQHENSSRGYVSTDDEIQVAQQLDIDRPEQLIDDSILTTV